MKTFFVILAIIALVAFVGLGPVLTILSLNTLFSTNIAITFGSWLSVAWLQLIAAGAVSSGIRLFKVSND